MAIQINTEQIKNLGVTNAKIANSTIANGKLVNSTISGIALGSNLSSLTAGNGISMTSYNGSAAISDLTIDLDGATLSVGGSGVKVSDGGITDTQISGSAAIADSKLATIAASNKVSGSAVQLAAATAIENSSGLRLKAATAGDGLAISGAQVLSVTVDDSTIEIDSDSLRIKDLGVTAAKLAGSIGNSKLQNSTVSFGGVTLALGSSDATPNFDLQDATGYAFSALTGSIANSQIGAGSISFDKLADSANICRLDQAETIGAVWSYGSNLPTASANPSSDNQLARKAYVDQVAQGLDLKGSCKVATTAAITLSGTQTIDGVSVVADDRVLVKNQASASTNGIYLCKAGSWVRSDDMAAGSDGAGAFTFIEQGTANGDAGFVCTSDSGAAVVGTNVLAFTQFSKSADISAGLGLVKNGNDFDVNVGDGIAIASDAVKVDLATNPGLQFTSNKLDLKLQANLGLMKDANGVKVDFDNTSIGIISNQLAVKDNAVSFAKLAIQPYTDGFSGDGTATTFDLNNRLDSAQLSDFLNSVRVFRNGLRMQNVSGSTPSGIDQYTVTDTGSATRITFGTAPLNSDVIIVDYWA